VESKPQSQTFTDTAGRAWLVEINAWQLKRVRQAVGVELGKMGVEELANLVGDVERFVDVLFELVRAEKHGVTTEDFGCSLGGDALESAVYAFWRAWANFCPSQTRQVMLRLATEAEGMTRRAVKEGMAKLDEMVPPTSNGSAGDSPAPPVATPTGGRYAN
jgi:hypothetical protein